MEQVEKSKQVEKFKERIIKSKSYKDSKVKVTKIFNFIDLTATIKKADSEKKIKEKIRTRFRLTPTKEKNYQEPTIFDTTPIETEYGSIKKFLNECHPDIQTLIHKNEFKSVTASIDGLIVVTKNRLRIVISTTGRFERQVKITDRKRNILFNGKTTIKIEKEERKIA